MRTGRSRTNRISKSGSRVQARSRGLYVYESAARELSIHEPMDVESKRQRQFRARRNREKAEHMNVRYVAFLIASFSLTAVILLSYVRVIADNTSLVNSISVLENELNSLKHSNDEEYSRIENSVSLDEIKRVAIEELGMTYASEGQVVLYEAAEADYVRQIEDIPIK